MSTHFILLHPDDNILGCCQRAAAGTAVEINDVQLTLQTDIDIGHKIAYRGLKKGDKIIKYGVSIGSALEIISSGDHVHLHNMKSDYISPHTRDRIQENPA